MAEREGGRSILDRIGGPNSVTWPGFWILFMISSLVSLASAASSASGSSWIAVMVVVVAAITVYGVLLLARVTVLRRVAERPRPWRTLACFLVATLAGTMVAPMVGGLLATTIGPAGASTAQPTPLVVLLSVLGTFVGAVLVLALAAVVVDAWREYRDIASELGELERQRVEVQTTTSAELEQQDARVRAEVEELLLSEIDALDAADTNEAAIRLRHAALDVVRPLSHDLGLGAYGVPEAERVETAIDPGALVRDATARRLFAPWISAVIISVPVLFSIEVSTPGLAGVIVAVMTFVEVGLLAWLANALYSTRGQHASVRSRLAWLLICVLLITGIALLTWLELDSVTGFGIAWGVLAWIVPVILLLPAVLDALRGVRQRQDRTREALQEDVDWQLARSRELVWVRKTTLARALHGPVQSAVLAASIRLETAAKSGEVSPSAIEDARCALNDALTAFAASPDEAIDLTEVFARLQEMWAGVSEITIDADPAMMDALARDRVCARAVADVVTEGCSNAVRHGKATHIGVRLLVEDPTRVRVALADNGHPLTTGGEGMGSRLLDAVAISWERTTEVDGTELSVLLPAQVTVG